MSKIEISQEVQEILNGINRQDNVKQIVVSLEGDKLLMPYTKEEQKKNRGKLVAALRSGEYQQSTGFLRTKDGYCCLGVGCEVFAKENDGEFVQNQDSDIFTFYLAPGNGNYVFLHNEVRDYFGFKSNNGRWGKDEKIQSLANLNDCGATFLEIADIIEAEPEGLCV